jgi:hypothetical protein
MTNGHLRPANQSTPPFRLSLVLPNAPPAISNRNIQELEAPLTPSKQRIAISSNRTISGNPSHAISAFAVSPPGSYVWTIAGRGGK